MINLLYLCVSITKALIINLFIVYKRLYLYPMLPLATHFSSVKCFNKRRKEREKSYLGAASYRKHFFKHQIYKSTNFYLSLCLLKNLSENTMAFIRLLKRETWYRLLHLTLKEESWRQEVKWSDDIWWLLTLLGRSTL